MTWQIHKSNREYLSLERKKLSVVYNDNSWEEKLETGIYGNDKVALHIYLHGSNGLNWNDGLCESYIEPMLMGLLVEVDVSEARLRVKDKSSWRHPLPSLLHFLL